MFSKMFKPLTLSFLLTAVCVTLAVWTAPIGLAGDNEECIGTVYSTGIQKCGDFGESSCNGSTGYRNRDDNYDCDPKVGKHCEIWQKSQTYKKNEYPCYWDGSKCQDGTRKSSGGKVNSCNTTDMPSSS